MSEHKLLDLQLILEENPQKLSEILEEYHESDIADAFELLDQEKRKIIYDLLDPKLLSSIFTYFDDPSLYLNELEEHHALNLLNEMDADDAIDALDDYTSDKRNALINQLDTDLQADIKLISSYSDEEIGSYMTTNFNVINKKTSIKDAMKQLVAMAAINDNINIIYTVDDDLTYYGAFHLKDLIIARSTDTLESIIYTNYPLLYDDNLIDEVLPIIKEYTLEYLPVLNKEKHIIGIITHDDIMEVLDNEMAEDFSKLAGLTSDIKANESLMVSIKKRIPWLVILLFLNLTISTLVAGFDDVIAVIPILAAFQSLLLGMAGNAGTQSLAITLLSINNEKMPFKKFMKHLLKELRVGFINALICGLLATVVVYFFVGIMFGQFTINNQEADKLVFSIVIGATLLIGMSISTIVATIIPMIFKILKIDPATASGPFITTINDLVSLFLYFSIIIMVFGTFYHYF